MKTKKGVLYCIRNDCYNYYGINIHKLGYSTNFENRMAQYITAFLSPTKVVHKSAEIIDAQLAEKILFDMLGDYRLEINREFFKCDERLIIDKINEVVNIVNRKESYEYKGKELKLDNIPLLTNKQLNNLENEKYKTNLEKKCIKKVQVDIRFKIRSY